MVANSMLVFCGIAMMLERLRLPGKAVGGFTQSSMTRRSPVS